VTPGIMFEMAVPEGLSKPFGPSVPRDPKGGPATRCGVGGKRPPRKMVPLPLSFETAHSRFGGREGLKGQTERKKLFCPLKHGPKSPSVAMPYIRKGRHREEPGKTPVIKGGAASIAPNNGEGSVAEILGAKKAFPSGRTVRKEQAESNFC